MDHLYGLPDGDSLTFKTLGAVALLIAFDPPTPCAVLTTGHDAAISIKADFIEAKFLYHTGYKCTREYASWLAQQFFHISDSNEQCNILMAIACVESGFDPTCDTTNKRGTSRGLMQIHDRVAKILHMKRELAYNPTVSILVGKEHFENVRENVRSYHMGVRGKGTERGKMLAGRYAVKVWRCLSKMKWVRKNKHGEPIKAYWKYFDK